MSKNPFVLWPLFRHFQGRLTCPNPVLNCADPTGFLSYWAETTNQWKRGLRWTCYLPSRTENPDGFQPLKTGFLVGCARSSLQGCTAHGICSCRQYLIKVCERGEGMLEFWESVGASNSCFITAWNWRAPHLPRPQPLPLSGTLPLWLAGSLLKVG